MEKCGTPFSDRTNESILVADEGIEFRYHNKNMPDGYDTSMDVYQILREDVRVIPINAEMHIAIIIGKGISLVGRNVDDYRSLFLPSTVSVGDGSKAKGVVDGAICMRFFRYPPSIQKEIADRFGSSVSDIMETLLKINEI